MLKLIIGRKGTGKTKQLIDSINEAVNTENGHIVFINNGTRHVFDLSSKVRLIDTSEYSITKYNTFYGFLCGVMAQDYDISNIFVDSVNKIITEDDIVVAGELFKSLDDVTTKHNVNIIITVSIDVADAPEYMKKYL
ncbi:MAG: twitching motility protein PilT [Bacillota bacterium]|nr:twitching motility protein PilT [Bacillota bacterium]